MQENIQLRERFEELERELSNTEHCIAQSLGTEAERERWSASLPEKRAILQEARIAIIEDEELRFRGRFFEVGLEGTKSRGNWRAEDGTFSLSAETIDEARALAIELQSIAGCKLERPDNSGFLYFKLDSSDEDAQESAARELAALGFEVSGDFDSLPDVFEVRSGFGSQFKRYTSAREDEALQVFRNLCDSIGAGVDVCSEALLQRWSPSTACSETVERYEADSETPALCAVVGKLRGRTYFVDSSTLCEYSELSYSELRDGADPRKAFSDILADSRAVFVSDFCSGSDYSGSGALGRSNYRELVALCKSEKLREGVDYWPVSGGHGTYAVALALGLRNEAIVDCMEKLESYPCIDEEALSEVESEDEAESWQSFVCSDFKRALESRFALELDAVSDEDFAELFRTACERSNTYWYHESDGAGIDVERVSKSVERAEALALHGAKREDEEAQAQGMQRFLRAAPLFAALTVEAAKPDGEREPDSLPDGCDAVAEALGAVPAALRSELESFVLQLARWPVASATPSPESSAEAHALLRRHVGSVMQRARALLLELAPDVHARTLETFGELPTETPKRD